MEFSIVFDNSGDVLPFHAVNPGLVEHYIDSVISKDINNFQSDDRIDYINQKLSKLHHTIIETNKFLHLYGLEKIDDSNLFDQYFLNKCHANWASSHEIIFNIDDMRFLSDDEEVRAEFAAVHELYPDEIRDVQLSDILMKRNRLGVYEDLNSDIHYFEASFRRIILNAVSTEYYTTIPNISDESIITNDICNLKVSYHVKGRTLYDKFMFFDMNLEHDDENNHKTQSTRLELSLAQPQTIPVSKEYIAWCKTHNRYPTGDFLNLGNLKNIQSKLTDYRHIVHRNLVNDNNCKLHI